MHLLLILDTCSMRVKLSMSARRYLPKEIRQLIHFQCLIFQFQSVQSVPIVVFYHPILIKFSTWKLNWSRAHADCRCSSCAKSERGTANAACAQCFGDLRASSQKQNNSCANCQLLNILSHLYSLSSVIGGREKLGCQLLFGGRRQPFTALCWLSLELT